MQQAQVYFAALYFCAAAIFSVLSVWVGRHRSAPIALPLTIMLVLGGVWALCDALFHLSSDVAAMMFWSRLRFVAIPFLPVAALILSIRHTRRSRWWDWRLVAPLLAVPAITCGLSLTASPFLRTMPGLDPTAPFPLLLLVNGPWGHVHLVYSYVVMMAAFIVLVRPLRREHPLFRGHTLTLLVGMLVPSLIDAASEVGVLPLYDFDPTPLGFLVTGMVMAWSLSRMGMMEIAPVAEHLVIETMHDPMLVLDNKERLVDFNPAAQRAFGLSSKSSIGGPLPAMLVDERGTSQLHGETVTISSRGRTLHYDLTLSPITDRKGRRVGSLLLLHDVTDRKAVEEDLRAANNRLSTQLEQIEALQAQLREQALHDSLTGLPNRRFLEEALHRALYHADREHAPLSLIMLDIDHFKAVNDSYGHEKGDMVLTLLAEMLRLQIRGGDIACRYGGEEFVVVLEGANLAAAAMRAEQLRQAMAQFDFGPELDGQHVTISAGVAGYPDDATTLNGLLRAADHALYRAKEAGRDRTCLAGGLSWPASIPVSSHVTMPLSLEEEEVGLLRAGA